MNLVALLWFLSKAAKSILRGNLMIMYRGHPPASDLIYSNFVKIGKVNSNFNSKC